MSSLKGIAILGSTGSIGRQTLEVIDENRELFRVSLLTSMGNEGLLISQAKKYQPNAVVICDESKYEKVREVLFPLGIKVFAGTDSLLQLIALEETDVVVNALVGFAGLRPTIETLKSHKILALANKESLVAAGELINRLVIENNGIILPIDSEHSAIFQCLTGEESGSVEKLILTASGGPFRGKESGFLSKVRSEDALQHPNWAMGPKITIDSATLMNKGFEVIEASYLYHIDIDRIEVLIHPQSIIHSMVQFTDGSVKAQLSLPDMRLPIQYALSFPDRIFNSFPRLDLAALKQLTFEKPDHDTFPNLGLAYEAVKTGGNAACILNAANEISVKAFLENRISFHDIYRINKKCIKFVGHVGSPTLEDLIETDKDTRKFATTLI